MLAGAAGCGGGGHDGSAGDGVGGEEDGDAAAGYCAGFGPDGPEFFGEGLGEERVFGPAGDEVDLHAFGGGHDGAAVEADAGAGVLRGEADGFEFADAFGAHLGDGVGYVWMPVAHADEDGSPDGFFEERGLAEGPLG